MLIAGGDLAKRLVPVFFINCLKFMRRRDDRSKNDIVDGNNKDISQRGQLIRNTYERR